MNIFHKLRKKVADNPELWIIFLIGVLLRATYVVATPIHVRSHDLMGHTEYIRYVVEHWTMPSDVLGWETHQPPLYYALTALWMHGSALLGRTAIAWQDLQLLSFLLSIGTLACGVQIAVMLFPAKRRSTLAMLFAGMIAALPGLVFLSSRISNDTLATLLMFAITALLLRWWKTGGTGVWWSVSGLCALGLITKVTVYPLIPIVLACLVTRREIPPAKKLSLASGFLILCAVIGGPFLALRLSQTYFLWLLEFGWGLGMNLRLLVPFHAGDFFVFHPGRLIISPLNDPWYDLPGRMYFWEYLFRSAFFGEWDFPGLLWPSRIIIAGALGLLPLAACGLVSSLRSREPFRIPLFLILLAGISLCLFTRIMHGAIPNQDFRFFPLLAVPFAAYVCYGIEALRKRWQMIGIVWAIALLFACGLFLLSVSLF